MPKRKKQNLGAGFTLIELLVVISIMSLISSVLLVSASKARMRARDAKRLQDLENISKALALYRFDNNNWPLTDKFPKWSGTTVDGMPLTTVSSDSTDYNVGVYNYFYPWSDLAQKLAPYMPSLPKDPQNTAPPNTYQYYSYSEYSDASGQPKIFYWDQDACRIRATPPGTPFTVWLQTKLEEPKGNGNSMFAGCLAGQNYDIYKIITVNFD